MIIEKFSVQANKLELLKNRITYQTRHYLSNQIKNLETDKNLLNIKIHGYFLLKKNAISIKSHYLDPENIMKRGYSITLSNGKPLKDSKDTSKDDIIETILYKGKIISKIK